MSLHEPANDDIDPAKMPDTKRVRPFSIDLSLELEHQLDNESLPPTPAHDAQYTSLTNTPDRVSLDPHILASLVVQLRQALTAVSEERDVLAQQHAGIGEALQAMTDKCTSLQDELVAAKTKAKDDEDAIAMLRNKVEESRRGLMRLQTESRRTSSISIAPLDLTSKQSKRNSFAPMTGNLSLSPVPGSRMGHRRISSVSDSALGTPDFGLNPNPPVSSTAMSPNPNFNGVIFGPSSSAFTSSSSALSSSPPSSVSLPPPPPPPSNRRFSTLFSSAQPSGPSEEPDLALEIKTLQRDITGLRKELQSARDELEDARHEAREANEAREASEMCVRALREFIGEHDIGNTPLPSAAMRESAPRPTITTAPGAHARSGSGAAGGGWGFKLWKADSVGAKSPVVTSSSPLIQSTTPLTSKIGGFFSGRGSISSTTSPLPVPPAAPEMSVSGSETSSIVDSIAEPLSPTRTMAEGNDTVGFVVVKDVTNVDFGSGMRAYRAGVAEVKEAVGGMGMVYEQEAI